jgi:hypothetical protein
MAYQLLIIKGETSDAEPFQIPLPIRLPLVNGTVCEAAKAILWDCRWIPGSVSWRVFQSRPSPLADLPLAIGENY